MQIAVGEQSLSQRGERDETQSFLSYKIEMQSFWLSGKHVVSVLIYQTPHMLLFEQTAHLFAFVHRIFR